MRDPPAQQTIAKSETVVAAEVRLPLEKKLTVTLHLLGHVADLKHLHESDLIFLSPYQVIE